MDRPSFVDLIALAVIACVAGRAWRSGAGAGLVPRLEAAALPGLSGHVPSGAIPRPVTRLEARAGRRARPSLLRGAGNDPGSRSVRSHRPERPFAEDHSRACTTATRKDQSEPDETVGAWGELSDDLLVMLRDALRGDSADKCDTGDTTAATGVSAQEEQAIHYLTVVHDEVDAEFEDARLEALVAAFARWCDKMSGPIACGVSRGRDHTTFHLASPDQDEMRARLDALARALDPGWWQIEWSVG